MGPLAALHPRAAGSIRPLSLVLPPLVATPIRTSPKRARGTHTNKFGCRYIKPLHLQTQWRE